MHLTLRRRAGYGNSFADAACIRGVIFDCDGVLLDTLESNAQFYNAILAQLDLPPMTKAQQRYVHSHTFQESMAHITPAEKRDFVPDALRQVRYWRDILPYVKLMRGAESALTRLQAMGYRLGVATNRTTTMPWVTERFQLQRFFFPMMTALKARAKPHPEQLHRVLHAWAMRPEDVVFVGDSAVDAETARRAGVRFWAFGDESLLADAHICDFETLFCGLNGLHGLEGRAGGKRCARRG